MQRKLWEDETKTKTIIGVDASSLSISDYNPRKSRNDEYIQRLADRIAANGYEITRAMWVYQDGDCYKVFAGGTRLKAVRLVGLEQVPVVLHTGFTDGEIVRLADEDNENDEYHEPVPLVDVWASYKDLADLGWTQDRIAKAKGVSRNLVSYRVNCANLPQSVLGIVTTHLLKERQVRELLSLSPGDTFWLSQEAALLHVITQALKRIPTAQTFKAEVQKANAAIRLVENAVNSFGAKWKGELFKKLQSYKNKGLSKVNAQRAIDSITGAIAKEKRELADAARIAADEAERAKIEAERLERLAILRAEILACVCLGDAIKEVENAPDNIKLVFTDPPYGVKFQSNRRVVREKAEVLQSDDGEAFGLLFRVAKKLYSKMATDSVFLCWSSWAHYGKFRQVLSDAGFELKSRPILWHKNNHTSGDLQAGYSPDTEPIIYATKGKPKFAEGRSRPEQTQTGNDFIQSPHPTKKPIDLIKRLILNHTEPGDIVADPFAGSGATILGALQTDRLFWACEINTEWHGEICSAILPEIAKMTEGK